MTDDHGDPLVARLRASGATGGSGVDFADVADEANRRHQRRRTWTAVGGSVGALAAIVLGVNLVGGLGFGGATTVSSPDGPDSSELAAPEAAAGGVHDSAAKGSAAAEDPGPDNTTELTARATVVDDGDGPELCFTVTGPDPPQCDGPEVAGWDWALAPGSETTAGVTWGDYVVVGTYDGTTFTVTRPPVIASGSVPPPLVTVDTPCAEPDDGWPSSGRRGVADGVVATLPVAVALPDYAGLWIDPQERVVNVAVTEDPARAESEIRAVWQGPLCVSTVRHTHVELERIRGVRGLGPDLGRLSGCAGQRATIPGR